MFNIKIFIKIILFENYTCSRSINENLTSVWRNIYKIAHIINISQTRERFR